MKLGLHKFSWGWIFGTPLGWLHWEKCGIAFCDTYKGEIWVGYRIYFSRFGNLPKEKYIYADPGSGFNYGFYIWNSRKQIK